jgi:hypothetical protein
MPSNCGTVPADDKSTKNLPKASVSSDTTRKAPPDLPRIAGDRKIG